MERTRDMKIELEVSGLVLKVCILITQKGQLCCDFDRALCYDYQQLLLILQTCFVSTLYHTTLSVSDLF